MTETRHFYRMWLLAVLLALIVLTLKAAPALAAGGVLHVDADAPGPTHDGLSWTTAYTNAQDALAAAVSGNEIWVAEGVYYPDEGTGHTADDRASTFALKSGVALYGGFVATETLRTQRDWDAHVTILSGDVDQNDSQRPVITDTTTVTNAENNATPSTSSRARQAPLWTASLLPPAVLESPGITKRAPASTITTPARC